MQPGVIACATRLGEFAARWNARKRPESLLLRGDDLDAAKVWIAERTETAPATTKAQRTFIRKDLRR